MVVGMARSGIAAVEFLIEQGANVTAVDQIRRPNPGLPDRDRASNRSRILRGADLIVLSPGVPADLGCPGYREPRGVRVVGDLELASWHLERRHHRNHRFQRKNHHDRADGTYSDRSVAFPLKWAAISEHRRPPW